MGSQTPTLHILFFPLMASGHMIPMVDTAKLLASRGIAATIVTIPGYAPIIQSAIEHANRDNLRLAIIQFPFPLPDGRDNMTILRSWTDRLEFICSLHLLREPFSQLLQELRPDCLVADMFFPWTLDVARDQGVVHLMFHGTSYFARCADHSVYLHRPHEQVADSGEPFIVPGIPHSIKMTNSQLLPAAKLDPDFAGLMFQIGRVEKESFGVVMNSFYELEPDYVDHYRRNIVATGKAWHVGPVSLCNKDMAEKSSRGNKASADITGYMNWLESKPERSVLYVCFGSLYELSSVQLREQALGLEASGHPFIWVVKGANFEWMPEGYEERVVAGGKGLIIRGWAPQILILGHRAVGGFMTHCGWNSCIEGIAAGTPMITWPMSADQFYNERLIVDVLKVGVEVGAKTYFAWEDDRMEVVSGEKVAEVVKGLMGGGEEVAEIRKRAAELAVLAEKAVEEDGSSYNDMSRLIQELRDERSSNTCSSPEEVKIVHEL